MAVTVSSSKVDQLESWFVGGRDANNAPFERNWEALLFRAKAKAGNFKGCAYGLYRSA